jgi:hypothetical protein
MVHALVFVLAPEASLPGDDSTWADLLQSQRQGVGSGVALRMFRVPPEEGPGLDALVSSGLADAVGSDPFAKAEVTPGEGADPSPAGERSSVRRLFCDAVVPHVDPRSLWLGAYELQGEELPGMSGHPADRLRIERIRCLDRFPLKEADNETCWFYPTDNGDYLCWENQRRLELMPGYPAESRVQEEPVRYRRSDLRVLWSLMADDQALTCVGLTYQRRRIEWPVVCCQPEPFATWTSFRVDSMAEETYRELANITVFPQQDD